MSSICSSTRMTAPSFSLSIDDLHHGRWCLIEQHHQPLKPLFQATDILLGTQTDTNTSWRGGALHHEGHGGSDRQPLLLGLLLQLFGAPGVGQRDPYMQAGRARLQRMVPKQSPGQLLTLREQGALFGSQRFYVAIRQPAVSDLEDQRCCHPGSSAHARQNMVQLTTGHREVAGA